MQVFQFNICIMIKGLYGRLLPAISHLRNQSNMFSKRNQQISLAELNEQCSEFYLFCKSIKKVLNALMTFQTIFNRKFLLVGLFWFAVLSASDTGSFNLISFLHRTLH